MVILAIIVQPFVCVWCVCVCACGDLDDRLGLKNMFINLLWGCKLISAKKRDINRTKHLPLSHMSHFPGPANESSSAVWSLFIASLCFHPASMVSPWGAVSGDWRHENQLRVNKAPTIKPHYCFNVTTQWQAAGWKEWGGNTLTLSLVGHVWGWQ